MFIRTTSQNFRHIVMIILSLQLCTLWTDDNDIKYISKIYVVTQQSEDAMSTVIRMKMCLALTFDC